MDKIMGRTKWLICILVLMMLLHCLQAQDEGTGAPEEPEMTLKDDEVETAQTAKNDGDADLKPADAEKTTVSEKEVSPAANDDDAPAITKVNEKDDNDLMTESSVTNDGSLTKVNEKDDDDLMTESSVTNDGDDDFKTEQPTVGDSPGLTTIGKNDESHVTNDGDDDLKPPDPGKPKVGEKEGSSGATTDGNDDLMPPVGDSTGLTKNDEKDESRDKDTVGEVSEPDADTEQTTQAPIEESSKQTTPYDIKELEAFTENAGYPFNRPKAHPGSKHIRAHDGFHNVKREKHWAHWNDFLTSPRY